MPLTDRDYDLISLYIDDALTPTERRAVESRLATDAAFRAEHEAIRQTIQLIKAMPEMIAPRDLRLTPEMAADILAEPRPAPAVRRATPTRSLRMWTTFASAAASLVLVLAGALTLLRPPVPETNIMSVAMVSDVPDERSRTAASTPTEKLDEGFTLGAVSQPAATMMPYELAGTPPPTGGMGSGVDAPGHDEQDVFAATDDAPAGVYMAIPEGYDTAPSDVSPSPQILPPPTSDDALAELTAPNAIATPDVTMDAEDGSLLFETSAVDPAGNTAASEERADMQQAAPVVPPSTARMSSTAVADRSLETAQDVDSDQLELTSESNRDMFAADELITAQSLGAPSPLLGFALVVGGLVLGGVTIFIWNRRP